MNYLFFGYVMTMPETSFSLRPKRPREISPHASSPDYSEIGIAIIQGKGQKALKLIHEGSSFALIEKSSHLITLAIHNSPNQELIETLISLANRHILNIEPQGLGCTPLFAAIAAGNTQIVQLLLEKGVNPNLRNKYGRTPLYHTIWFYPTTSILNEMLKKKKCNPQEVAPTIITIASLLIKHGADIDATVENKTSLHTYLNGRLVERIDPEVISYFISEGADSNKVLRNIPTSPQLMLKIDMAVQKGLFQRKCAVEDALKTDLAPIVLRNLVLEYV